MRRAENAEAELQAALDGRAERHSTHSNVLAGVADSLEVRAEKAEAALQAAREALREIAETKYWLTRHSDEVWRVRGVARKCRVRCGERRDAWQGRETMSARSFPSEPRVSFPGPFSQHSVVVDGWKVPLIHAQPCGDNDENVMLVIDDRLAATFTVDEAERFVPFLADAIAVALGYTCHPSGDETANWNPQPRPVRTHGVVGDD